MLNYLFCTPIVVVFNRVTLFFAIVDFVLLLAFFVYKTCFVRLTDD